jgi:hypothetical protein
MPPPGITAHKDEESGVISNIELTDDAKSILDKALIAAWRKDLSEERKDNKGFDDYIMKYRAQLSNKDKPGFDNQRPALFTILEESYTKGKAAYRAEHVFGVGKTFTDHSSTIFEIAGRKRDSMILSAKANWAFIKLGCFEGYTKLFGLNISKRKELSSEYLRLDRELQNSKEPIQRSGSDVLASKFQEEIMTAHTLNHNENIKVGGRSSVSAYDHQAGQAVTSNLVGVGLTHKDVSKEQHEL